MKVREMNKIYNKYSLSENLKNIHSFFLTKLFYKKARLIRRPFYLRGKSLFEYGEGFTTGYGCRIEIFSDTKEKILKTGDNLKIGDNVHIACGKKVVIGNNVLIASNVYISDISHGVYKGENQTSPSEIPDKRKISATFVTIGNNVWIGENVCVLPSVSIGNGAIIGAGSIVTKNVPDNCIAVGTPAQVIKIYNKEKNRWESINKN